MNCRDVPQHIFRAYDIRGKVGKDITVRSVMTIARAFAAHFLREPGQPLRVVLARDVRSTSEELAAGAAYGLLQAGAEIWDAGVVPTPLAYFAMGRWQATGGVVVTASHNPPDENGMKLRHNGDQPFFDQDLKALCRRLNDPIDFAGPAKYERRDPYPEYFDAVVAGINLDRAVKVVLDVGNGAAALTAPRVLQGLGCEVEVMFGEIDGGQFRGRGPNPLHGPAMQLLGSRVVETQADIGIALDADGDRIVICDDKGQYIPPDKATIPLISDILKRRPDARFVTEVRCSYAVRDFIREVTDRDPQEVLIMTACGYPFIIKKRDEVGAALGFEKTGHYYFDNPVIKFDDATYAAARMVEVLSRIDVRLSEFMQQVPAYYTTDDVRWKCPDEFKFKVVEAAKEEYGKLGYDLILVDGVRAEREDGWALIRASNTAPQLVMSWEGKTKKAHDEIGAELQDIVARVMYAMGLEPGVLA